MTAVGWQGVLDSVECAARYDLAQTPHHHIVIAHHRFVIGSHLTLHLRHLITASRKSVRRD